MIEVPRAALQAGELASVSDAWIACLVHACSPISYTLSQPRPAYTSRRTLLINRAHTRTPPQVADFFSFGTNDLTQTTFGISRDDAEAKFLSQYIAGGIMQRDPFETLDTLGGPRAAFCCLPAGQVPACGLLGHHQPLIAACRLLAAAPVASLLLALSHASCPQMHGSLLLHALPPTAVGQPPV
jgi:hypothetical protein